MSFDDDELDAAVYRLRRRMLRAHIRALVRHLYGHLTFWRPKDPT